jgi:hypothetical protein
VVQDINATKTARCIVSVTQPPHVLHVDADSSGSEPQGAPGNHHKTHPGRQALLVDGKPVACNDDNLMALRGGCHSELPAVSGLGTMVGTDYVTELDHPHQGPPTTD